jgi:hypothetical protein
MAQWITAFAGMTGEAIPSPILPRKEERVRSDVVETLDVVGGEGDGSEQLSNILLCGLSDPAYMDSGLRRNDRLNPRFTRPEPVEGFASVNNRSVKTPRQIARK